MYKRQAFESKRLLDGCLKASFGSLGRPCIGAVFLVEFPACLLYTSDAADERSSVDLGGRRIIKKKNKKSVHGGWIITEKDI